MEAVLVVVVKEIPEHGISLLDGLAGLPDELSKQYSVVQDSLTKVVLPGFEAYRADLDVIAEGNPYRQTFLVLASRSRGFVLSAGIPTSYVEVLQPLVDRWFESFEVLPVESKARWHKQDTGFERDQSNYPQSLNFERFNDVAFVDENIGWVVGFGGRVLHTSDGGMTWAEQTSKTSAALSGITFADANSGWTVGGKGTVIHTEDGGNTWALQDSGTTANLLDVTFVDADNGWPVGSDGTILHTSNGGSIWTKQESGAESALWAVAFLDQHTGWSVGGQGTILHTTDGGNTWTEQASGATADLTDVVFLDHDTGWSVGAIGAGADHRGALLQTVDGGLTGNQRTSASSLLLGAWTL